MTVWSVASEMPNRKQDYLYFAKGIDFNHESMRPDLNLPKKNCHPPNIPWVMEKTPQGSNVRWDGRYCLLNGFLETSVAKLHC